MMNIQLEHVRKSCRVCLEEKGDMIPMNSLMQNETHDDSESLTILQCLEKVMAVTVDANEKYPINICSTCRELLQTLYHFHMVFYKSQMTLEDVFKSNFVKDEEDTEIIIIEIVPDASNCEDNRIDKLQDGASSKEIYEEIRIITDYEESEGGKDLCTNDLSPQKEVVGVSLKDEWQLKNDSTSIEDTRSNQKDEHLYDHLYAARFTHICSICGMVCAKKATLVKHEKFCKVDYSLPCEKCGNDSFTEIKQEQDDVKTHLCSKCGLIRNLKNKKYLCHVCGVVSKTKHGANYHQKTHIGPDHMCGTCGKKYYYASSLKLHMNKHKNIRNELCSICGKAFNYKTALTYHMRSHRNEKNYYCTICPKKFFMPGSLNRHIRTHNGERPYVCSFCEKGFFSLGEKRKHEMIHTNERPYKCEFCDKAFYSTFNRKIHYMAHKGPHECPCCHRTFIDVRFLRAHVTQKHQDLTKSDSQEC